MRETRTSGLMSGDGKRGDANLAQATAPVLDSTKGIAPSLVKLLDLIAHYMVETEAEVQAQRLREQIEQARQELLARGVPVPAIIDVVPDRIIN
jgi:hypothetical protein